MQFLLDHQILEDCAHVNAPRRPWSCRLTFRLIEISNYPVLTRNPRDTVTPSNLWSYVDHTRTPSVVSAPRLESTLA